MTIVDRRVVSIGLENRNFQDGASQTMSTVDKLKEKLNFTGIGKAFGEINTSSSRVDLSHIAASVDSISSKFNALGVIGFTVFNNLAQSAINLGKELVNSLAIAPIRTGFSEYETLIGSIQTVLANTSSKGTTLDDVNQALDELNNYSDKTIYNFQEMARNVGTFTAAGVELDVATGAIKGIANLAAVSGSNAQQAASAMYQLSQAMAAGTVKLLDWNSVVYAGMGGEVFKNSLIETARAHGVAVDDIIAKNGSFRESLHEGWITTEVLVDTLAKFTNDLTDEQLKSMGYTQEQIVEIQKMAQIAEDAASKVKTFSQLKSTVSETIQSGWALSWRYILGDFEEAKELFSGINDFLSGIISASADSRNKVLKDWSELGGRSALLKGISNIFSGFASVVEQISNLLGNLIPDVTGTELAQLSKNFLSMSVSVRNFLENSVDVKNILKGVVGVVRLVIGGISAFIQIVRNLAAVILPSKGAILDWISGWAAYIAYLADAAEKSMFFGKIVADVTSFFHIAKRAVLDFATNTVEWFQRMREDISNFFSQFDLSGVRNFVKALGAQFSPLKDVTVNTAGWFERFMDFLNRIKPDFSSFGKVLQNSFANIKNSISEGLKNYNFGKLDLGSMGLENIDYNTIFSALTTGLVGALVFAVKKFLKDGSSVFTGLKDILAEVQSVLGGVRQSLEAYQKSLQAKTLIMIAGAIGILVAAIIAMTFIDPDKLMAASFAMGVLFTELMLAMQTFDKMGGGTKILAVVPALLGVSAALLILAFAMGKLSQLDSEALGRGVSSMGFILTGLVVFTKTVGDPGKMLQTSAGLVVLAGAMYVLATSLAYMGNMDQEDLSNGLNQLAKSLIVFLGTIYALEKMKADVSLAKFGLGIAVMSGALWFFSTVIERYSTLKPESTAMALILIAGALLVMGTTMRLMTGSVAGAAALIIMVGALQLLLPVLITFMLLDTASTFNGILKIGAALIVLVAAVDLASNGLKGAAALTIIIAALYMLVPLILLLGNTPWQVLGIGIGAIVLSLGLLGGVAAIIAPVVPVLLSLAAAIFLMGAAVAVGSFGIGVLAANLALLAAAGAGVGYALKTAIEVLIPLIPAIAEALGEGLIILAVTIGTGGPAIVESFKIVLLSLIAAIGEVFPVLLSTFVGMLLQLIAGINLVIPAAIESIVLLVDSLLAAIAEKSPDMVESAYEILISWLTGFRDNINEVAQLGFDIIIELMDAFEKKMPELTQKGFDMMITFLESMADSIRTNLPLLNDAITDLVRAIIDGIVDGLLNAVSEVAKAAIKIGKSIIDAIMNFLDAHSPSRKTEQIANWVGEGLVIGLHDSEKTVSTAAKSLGEKLVAGIESTMDRIAALANAEFEIQPVVRPVVDMSNVRAAGTSIGGLLSNTGLTTSVTGRLSSMVLSNQNGSSVNQPENITNTTSTNVNFTQINNSPEPLSRLEIYRQTQQQLKMFQNLQKFAT